jgi:iron complex transport system ATP-binding protein
MHSAQLVCNDLNICIDGRTLVHDLNLAIPAGSFVCMLGTNGVGKTLTLQTLAGLRGEQHDAIHLCGESLGSMSRKKVALRLGLLLQMQEDAFPLSVMEAVLMGRYPHMGLWQWPDNEDRSAVTAALQSFDLLGLEHRPLASLSGGERERVALATLMAQGPDIWLLDEPMNHLDPQHQLQVMRALKRISSEGRVVIASLHNPAMAMRFADYVLLFYGAGEWEYGPAAELLDPQRLERTYQTPFEYFRNGSQQLLLPV